jgi:peroxiredoxin Q/BCP
MATIPAFSLPGSDGATWSSKGLKGRRYVLYFYPKDDTPGCTQEACDFRDQALAAAAPIITVLGVSPDSVARHQSFIAKHQLPFVLLSDDGHVLAEKLGVWAMKKNYGREYLGIVRSTFLVDERGTILRAWRGVKVRGHAQEVIAAATAS